MIMIIRIPYPPNNTIVLNVFIPAKLRFLSCLVQSGQGLMSNGTQVVVSAVNPADLATKLKDATQVVQVPTGALSTIDWASKLKVSLCCQ